MCYYCCVDDNGWYYIFGGVIMMVNLKQIEEKTRELYNKAKSELLLSEQRTLEFQHSAISDVIPNYTSDLLNFGAYKEDNFAVLFIDMRNSTPRYERIGAQKTFLSMHAFIPAMLQVVEHYKGHVIDLMGDGIMVFFYGKDDGFPNELAIKHAGLCGRDMLTVVDKIVNKILAEDGITYAISCGVGVDYGKTVITKIGIENVFDVKAFGDCINKASKYSKVVNAVKVGKKVKEHWPKSKDGNISFITDGEGYLLISK